MATQTRKINKIQASTLVHATEDVEKVKKAMITIAHTNEIPLIKTNLLKGFFGDPITNLAFELKHRKDATDCFNNIIQSLSSLDLTLLLNELNQRIDKSRNMYLRLDKQKAYQGKFVLNSHDSIRVKAQLLLPHKSDSIKLTREYILEITGGNF